VGNSIDSNNLFVEAVTWTLARTAAPTLSVDLLEPVDRLVELVVGLDLPTYAVQVGDLVMYWFGVNVTGRLERYAT
jgi:hypothetical protein